MRPYTANTNAGRIKARDDIHHKTSDGGRAHRAATAKAQRKAARRDEKEDTGLEPSGFFDSTDSITVP